MTTITISRAVAEQALEALELGYDTAKAEADRYHTAMAGYRPERHAQMDAEVQQIAAAITNLRDALAQQAEPVEPVAIADGTFNHDCPIGTLLYTAPPQRKPLPKQDQHCVDVPGYGLVSVRLVRAVERAHGITDPQVADRLARHGIPMPEEDPK